MVNLPMQSMLSHSCSADAKSKPLQCSSQVYLMMDLLQPIQYARAECCAWPAMFDASELGLVAVERCRKGMTST